MGPRRMHHLEGVAELVVMQEIEPIQNIQAVLASHVFRMDVRHDARH